MQFEYLRTAESQVDAWLAEVEREATVTYANGSSSSASHGHAGSASAAVAAAAREQARAADQRRRLLLPSAAEQEVRTKCSIFSVQHTKHASHPTQAANNARQDGDAVAATGAAGALAKAMLRDRQRAIKRAVEEGSDHDSASDSEIVSYVLLTPTWPCPASARWAVCRKSHIVRSGSSGILPKQHAGVAGAAAAGGAKKKNKKKKRRGLNDGLMLRPSGR